MNHLEQVQAARAALEEHQTNHALPAEGENFGDWYKARLKLIWGVLASERAAVEAGEVITETTEF